jgi:hypothetical protein
MTRAAALASILLLGACAAPRCRNTVVQRVVAPDGAHDAVVYHRSCGRGTGASTEVAVLPHEADLPDLPTSVLTLSDLVGIGARWTSPSELAVSYPENARVVASVNRSSEGVAVVYATDPEAGRAR